jgi:PBP1b-binding outer membrane lipoprotein LpoB
MRGTAAIVLLLALTLTGCSGDPATSRLKEGTEAIAFSDRYDVVLIDDSPGDAFNGRSFESMPVGTKVMVAKDDGPSSDRLRTVRVIPATGEWKGRNVKVHRDRLRPAP